MCRFGALLVCVFFVWCTSVECKIVLPNKLRYLENMLNSEVVAKAAKIRQRIEANPNAQDGDKGWPMLLAKYQEEKKEPQAYVYNNIYNRRYQNY